MGQPSFQQQKMQVQKAYQVIEPNKPLSKPTVVETKQTTSEAKQECKDLFAEIKVDALDRLYVQARTVLSSQFIWGCFIIGFMVAIPFILKKFFGLNVKFNVERTTKDKP